MTSIPEIVDKEFKTPTVAAVEEIRKTLPVEGIEEAHTEISGNIANRGGGITM